MSDSTPGAAPAEGDTIVVTPTNVPPVADAGQDQTVNEGLLVVLDGSGSDVDGTVSKHAWAQTDGLPVTIIDADKATASFMAPLVTGSVVFAFKLTVTDDKGETGTDIVIVTVNDVVPIPPPALPFIFKQTKTGKWNVKRGTTIVSRWDTEADAKIEAIRLKLLYPSSAVNYYPDSNFKAYNI